MIAGEVITENALSVNFVTVEDIQEFVHLVKDFQGDIDMKQGRMAVDGKSILGICSLNMQEKMELVVQSGDFEEIKEIISKFTK